MIYSGTALLASAIAFSFVTSQPEARREASTPQIPRFQVDATWPKPFPSTPDPVTGRPRVWIPGEVAGTCTDAQDHIFIVTRGNLIAPRTSRVLPRPR
jgi:hypothetical protein